MRRLIAVSVLVATASMAAACTPSHSSSPNGGKAAPVSSTAICTKLRAVVTDDIGPIGTALGTIVGDATAKNAKGLSTAQDDAKTAITKLGTDLKTTADTGDVPTVKTAAASAETNITTLMGDPSFLSDINSMDDVATATAKLQGATAPITVACQGP
ncbi:MAG TPA: hypothetical protein VGJ28_06565 [Micromonosporaceae bacterium]|jgi:hypothetical protein